MLERLWLYQKERFPLFAFALLALAAGSSATAFSSLLRGAAGPSGLAVLAATAAALLIWMQMRVLDEFKDAEDDARHRAYRPVPRGLVTLGELRVVFVVAGGGEIALALAVDAHLLWMLAGVWAYLALMSVEFLAREWLRARPGAYLATHCPIGFLVAYYLAAFDWMPVGAAPQPALMGLALASLLATVLLEIGRKIRAPQDEEPGVVTYSRAWGRARSTAAWLTVLLAVLIAGGLSARAIDFTGTFAALAAPVAIGAAACCWRYLRTPQRRQAKRIEAMSVIGTLVLHLSLGPLPVLLAQ